MGHRDGVRNRAEDHQCDTRKWAPGEQGKDPRYTIADEQGVAGERDHPLPLRPRLVVNIGVTDDGVGEVGMPLGGDAADLQGADWNAGVGTVDMGIETGAGPQHQDARVRLVEGPDAGEGGVEVGDERLRAALEFPGEGIAACESRPDRRPEFGLPRRYPPVVGAGHPRRLSNQHRPASPEEYEAVPATRSMPRHRHGPVSGADRRVPSPMKFARSASRSCTACPTDGRHPEPTVPTLAS